MSFPLNQSFSLTGKETGSLAEGLKSPKSTSARAFPIHPSINKQQFHSHTHFLSGEESKDDSLDLAGPWHEDGAGAVEDDDGVGLNCCNGLDEFVLRVGKGQVLSGSIFSRDHKEIEVYYLSLPSPDMNPTQTTA